MEIHSAIGTSLSELASSHPEWGFGNDLTDRWQLVEAPLIYGFANCYHATIVQVPGASDFPYRMWFFGWSADDTNTGWPGCDAIFHARSNDLKSWEVYAGEHGWDHNMDASSWVPVLASATDRPWDQWHNGDPSVVWHDGVFYMAYTSTGFNLDGMPPWDPADTDGDLCCVLGATSTDGIAWERTSFPLVMDPMDLGRLAFGDPGPNTHGFSPFGYYARPSLLLEDGMWRLWFDFSAREHSWDDPCLGYAEAPVGEFGRQDAFVIQNWPAANPVPLNFWNPEVIKVDDLYVMFGDPLNGTGRGWLARTLSMAVSADRQTWHVVGELHPVPGTATHVPTALLHCEHGRRWLLLFFATQRGGDPYDYRYDAMRCMRLEVPEGGLLKLLAD